MGIILDIGLEDGTLDEFDSAATDEGDLSVETAAALGGSVEGLQMVVDDTNFIAGRGDFTWTTDDHRFRFYIDPNGLTMSEGDEFNVIQNSSGGLYTVRLRLTSGDYNISSRIATDGGSAFSAAITITDAPHYIEIHQRRATTNSASDGFITMWIDGSEVDDNTGLDIFDVAVQGGFWFGASATDAGTSGTFYMDQFLINDDGGEIGAHGGAALRRNLIFY